MYDAIKDMNEKMAKKFLEKEKRVGNMMALLTSLFFLVYIPSICLRAVSVIKYLIMWNKISSYAASNEIHISFIFLMFSYVVRFIQTLGSPNQQEQ